MKHKIFLAVLSGFLLAPLAAQDMAVQRQWGKVLGYANTDRDFLIYDATCPQAGQPAIYIVGKAEEGSAFELKQGENTYFHAKDETTDAFLACLSSDGELLWSTYLPAMEDGYYNAFATAIEYTSENTLIVTGNTYAIQGDIAGTRNRIPDCPGKSFILELDTNGRLLRQKTLIAQFSEIILPPPHIIKLADKSYVTSNNYLFGGIGLVNQTEEDKVKEYFYSYFFSYGLSNWDEEGVYNARNYLVFESLQPYYYAYYMCTPDKWNVFCKYPKDNQESLLLTRIEFKKKKSVNHADKAYRMELLARGTDLLYAPDLAETWEITSSNPDSHHNQTPPRHYAYPVGTYKRKTGTAVFPGTVQNIRACNGRFLVQGIHCRDYDNGFFKKDGKNYTYSHDTTHLIPKPSQGFYQERKKELTAVPYMLLYDSVTFFDTDLTNADEDNGLYDFRPPLWGSYLNAEWLYEDMFHLFDSGQMKDLYQPYEPVLLSSGNQFFLIGNAKHIDLDLIDHPAMTEEIHHHQGVILAFSTGCPGRRTAFKDVPHLCPGDSVELSMPAGYAGFRFRFDSLFLADTSIVLNTDSTQAWVKKPGRYTAILDGSLAGCPDAVVDTVEISFSPYPEPLSALPDDTLASCAAHKPLLQAVKQPDTTFSCLWYDGDTALSKRAAFAGDSILVAHVQVNGYCSSFSDTAVIRFLPPFVNLGSDTILCDRADEMPDTAVILRLDAGQDYFPAADWFFRWQVDDKEAGNEDSLRLTAADLDSIGFDRYQAIVSVSVFVSLSDTATAGCTASDTLVVKRFELPGAEEGNLFLPRDTILCAHLDLDLVLPPQADDYHCFWLDKDSILLPFGNDTARFSIQGMRGADGFGQNTDTRQPRFFQLALLHRHCPLAFLDSLHVFDLVRPAMTLPFHDTVVCLDIPVRLDSLNPLVYRPFYDFRWNDGKQGSDFEFSRSGTFSLAFFVRDDFNLCRYDSAFDSVHVLRSDPALTRISLPEDTAFCKKRSITLDASLPFPSTRYCWQEGILEDLMPDLPDSLPFSSPQLHLQSDQEADFLYGLFLLDSLGCLNARQVAVKAQDCSPALHVPNVFTPNGDGVNDLLRFTQLEHCFDLDILIVDRKGATVLKQKIHDPDHFAWNGCFMNRTKKLPDGPYFYFISFRDAYGKKKQQSGSITILGSNE